MWPTVRMDHRIRADAGEGLRDVLARRAAPSPAAPVKLPTGGSGGLQPGVTLDSNAALLGVMDREP